MNGAMVHVPVGKKGVIVQIAGQTTMSPTPWGVPMAAANEHNTAINNTYVDIYDIESGYWFRQATFGQITRNHLVDFTDDEKVFRMFQLPERIYVSF